MVKAVMSAAGGLLPPLSPVGSGGGGGVLSLERLMTDGRPFTCWHHLQHRVHVPPTATVSEWKAGFITAQSLIIPSLTFWWNLTCCSAAAGGAKTLQRETKLPHIPPCPHTLISFLGTFSRYKALRSSLP